MWLQGCCLSPLENVRFIDEIGDPNFGAYFDVGNILGTGYPDQWIRILGPRIKRIHVKDRKAGPTGGGMPLLAGDVPWDRVMRELRAIGYDSYLTAEIGTFKHHAEEGATQISRESRRLDQLSRVESARHGVTARSALRRNTSDEKERATL